MMCCFCLSSYAQTRIEDMDEEEWLAQKDTMLMTRKNQAKATETINAMDYILDDFYKPGDESFGKHWYDNVYLGISGGMEQMKREEYVSQLTPITQASVMFGKLFTPKHSARVSLGGGAGFQKGTGNLYYRGTLKGDYLFSLSTHFNGFNPTRWLDVSLLAGLGGTMSKLSGTKMKASAEVHAGLQFKVYTGPYGSFAVEPYVGMATDAVDLSEGKNWRGYDLLYGLNFNYIFYTDDNLSKESRIRLLQQRLNGDRLIDRYSLSSWRTPWFFEYTIGMTKGDKKTGTDATGLGNDMQFSIGRWMSPVIGLRGSVGSKILQWDREVQERTIQTIESNYNSHYVYGRVDALFNPFGFMRSFNWDKSYGSYLLFGAELGSIKKYQTNSTVYTTTAASYSTGIHLWYRLSKDLQFFAEPAYCLTYYRLPEDEGIRAKTHEKNFQLNLGITMLMRSHRYREPDEFDKVQNFNYRYIRGFSFALAGGIPVLQRRQVNYGNDGCFNYSGMLYGEYRFNHLHGVRVALDLMNLDGREQFSELIFKVNSRMLVTSLNYELNLTNLLSGRFRDRTFQLELFAGVAAGKVISGSKGQTSLFPGLDAGLKVSVPVWKGLSVVAMPTMYILSKSQLPGTNTVGLSDNMKIYQTLNIGVQCDLNMFKRNPEKAWNRRLRNDNDWAEKQRKAIIKYEQKRQKRLEKRHR